VLATHDAQVAARCDRVVRLLDGRVTDNVDVRAAADPGATARPTRPARRALTLPSLAAD
jgi:putative ABC transport system ATP-binding protein